MSNNFIKRIIHNAKKLTAPDWLFIGVLLILATILLINRTIKQEQWVSIKIAVGSDEWWWGQSDPPSWYGKGLFKGQNAYNTFGKKIAEIQSVENYDVGGPYRKIFVNLKILTSFNKKTQTYLYDYQPLQTGKPLDLTFGQNNIRGLVTYIGADIIPLSVTEFEVKLLAIHPWEAISFAKGMQMKALDGGVVATINQVDTTNATTYEIYDNYKRPAMIQISNDSRKDVTIRLSAKTYKVNSVPYYIDGGAIKIGNHISIEFETTAIKDAIISAIY